MKPILFYDPNSFFSYDHETLNSQSLGGTEGSIIRIAEKLGEHYQVIVAQGKKTTHTKSAKVHYVPLLPFLFAVDWHAVIIIRAAEAALKFRKANPHVTLWLWLHDLIDMRFFRYLHALEKEGIRLITVSDFHYNQAVNLFSLDPLLNPPALHRIYNPIEDSLKNDGTPYDKNKLLFASSPHKGLDVSLECFKRLHEEHPQFQLYISNPGYHTPLLAYQDGVKVLGKLTHKENMEQMRNSLALFQLNYVQPETFGLTLLEANAVGTPVLTHPLGAASEVLSNPEQLMNTYDIPSVIKKIVLWHKGDRPVVSISEKFRLNQVIQEWTKILN